MNGNLSVKCEPQTDTVTTTILSTIISSNILTTRRLSTASSTESTSLVNINKNTDVTMSLTSINANYGSLTVKSIRDYPVNMLCKYIVDFSLLIFLLFLFAT